MVQQADLHQILAKGTGLNIVVVGLGDAAKKVHGVGVAKVVVEGRQDEALRAEDLGLSEAIIGDVAEIGDVRGENLLILGGNEHCGNTDKLKTIELDDLCTQETIDDVDGKEQRLGQQVESSMDLNEPVDENTASLPLEVVLVVHVLRVRHGFAFQVTEVLEDFRRILGNHKGVLEVFSVKVLNTWRIHWLSRDDIANDRSGGLGDRLRSLGGSSIFLDLSLDGLLLLGLFDVKLLAGRLTFDGY